MHHAHNPHFKSALLHDLSTMRTAWVLNTFLLSCFRAHQPLGVAAKEAARPTFAFADAAGFFPCGSKRRAALLRPSILCEGDLSGSKAPDKSMKRSRTSLHGLRLLCQRSASAVGPRSAQPTQRLRITEEMMRRAEMYREYSCYRASRRDMPAARALLDLRSFDEFHQGHLPDSTSIPVDELEDRLYELPPPYEEAISLFGHPNQLARARHVVGKHRWRVEAEIDCLLAPAAWRERSISGAESRPVWKPSDLLAEFFSSEAGRLWARSRKDGGIALDVGCGAGRDAVLMKQALGPPWRVIGIDNDAGRASTTPHAPAALRAVRVQSHVETYPTTGRCSQRGPAPCPPCLSDTSLAPLSRPMPLTAVLSRVSTRWASALAATFRGVHHSFRPPLEHKLQILQSYMVQLQRTST